jgi:hypothetical protein
MVENEIADLSHPCCPTATISTSVPDIIRGQIAKRALQLSGERAPEANLATGGRGKEHVL